MEEERGPGAVATSPSSATKTASADAQQFCRDSRLRTSKSQTCRSGHFGTVLWKCSLPRAHLLSSRRLGSPGLQAQLHHLGASYAAILPQAISANQVPEPPNLGVEGPRVSISCVREMAATRRARRTLGSGSGKRRLAPSKRPGERCQAPS